jgi:hypothetical protein
VDTINVISKKSCIQVTGIIKSLARLLDPDQRAKSNGIMISKNNGSNSKSYERNTPCTLHKNLKGT